MFKEIDFCGVYFPPIFLCLLIACLVYVPLHWCWDRIALQRWIWNRPLCELALFVIVLAGAAFIL